MKIRYIKGEEYMIENVQIPNNMDVYIWGAGNTAVLAHQGMLRENLYKELNIVGFIDSKKSGSTLNGLPVFRPNVLEEKNPETVFVLICTNNLWMFKEIDAELNKKKITHELMDSVIIKHKYAEYQKVMSLLDEHSKDIYQRMLIKRMNLELIDDDLYGGEAYFGIPEFCLSRPSDVMLDCGAYVGDSIERYIWRMEMYRRLVAIEPDRANYKALCKRVERLKTEWNLVDDRIVPILAGVDEKTYNTNLETRVGGLGSIISEDTKGTDTLPFWAIDDLVKEKGWDKEITYIKADIESYEYRMLLGARRTIKECHPRMAICIYHNAVDMYSIPLLIHEIDGSYKFAVRHHSYSLAETVLYAY